MERNTPSAQTKKIKLIISYIEFIRSFSTRGGNQEKRKAKAFPEIRTSVWIKARKRFSEM